MQIFYSPCILVRHGGIPTALLGHERTPGVSPWTAALQDLLREPTMPEAITFPKQFKTQEDYALNLFIFCTRSFMGDELLEIGQFMLIQRHKRDCRC